MRLRTLGRYDRLIRLRRGGRVWAAVLAAGLFLASGVAQAGDVYAGRSIYQRHCERCHGADGRPLVPATPDFSLNEGLMTTDVDLIRLIKQGKGLMPGYDKIISEKDILDVLAYTRTLVR